MISSMMISKAEYEILPTNISDLNQLIALEKVCFLKSDMWSFLDYIAVLSFLNIITFKAVYQKKMAGFIAIDEKSLSTLAQIMTIGVHPSYQNMGIGTALLAKAEESIKNSDSIELVVRVDNYIAISLYKKFGYQIAEIRKKYYRDNSNGQRMIKILN